MEKNKTQEIALRLNESVQSVVNADKLVLFERAYQIAAAAVTLKNLLTAEYMAPIMQLQGNRLGFKTDKDKSGGYPVETVKNCIIEATLMGLQVCGNQFNIIAGNTYATKEGLGYLLNNFNGLSYDLVCGLPKINPGNTSAAIEVTIRWTLNGTTKEKVIPIPLKMDQYTSVDALIGKATRKGRKWLYDTITGSEIPEGDIQDITYTDVTGKGNEKKTPDEIEHDRKMQMLADCKTAGDVFLLQRNCPDWDVKLFDDRKAEILANGSK